MNKSSAASPSIGGNSAANSTSGGAIPGNKSSSSKKYKFHPDYATAVHGEDQKRKQGGSAKPRHIKRHPFEDDDEFWQKKYKIVNYRKKYPKDYDEKLFETLYEWITNGERRDMNDGSGENILFKDGSGKIGAKLKPRSIRMSTKENIVTPLDSSVKTIRGNGTTSLDPTRKSPRLESPRSARSENAASKSPEQSIKRSKSSELVGGHRASELEANLNSDRNSIKKVTNSASLQKVRRRRSSSMGKKVVKRI